MSYGAGYDQTGGGYIPPPDDNTNPNSDAGGFFGPADATPPQDYRPEKAFWDDQGSSEPASKASFWDDQGSSTPAPSDQPGFTPEAGTKRKTDFWDNAVAPADTGEPTRTGFYQGEPTYVSPVDYNAYEGEPPPYDIKDMERLAAGRANPWSPEGYGATYVSPPTYNKVELGLGDPVWEQGPTPNSRRRAQPYDLPAMTYEANDRRTVQELNDLTQGMNLEQGQTPSNFVPDVPLDPSQVIDFRNDGTFMGPIESVYNPRNETWNRRYGSDVTGDTTRKYGFTDEGGGAGPPPLQGPYWGSGTYVSPYDYNAYEGEPPIYDIRSMEALARIRNTRAAATYNPDLGEGYGRTYVSPVDVNNVAMTWPGDNESRRLNNQPWVPYDIPLMESDANDRRTVQELNDIWNGQRPQRQPGDPAGGQFDPNVQLDPSQVTDMRGQRFIGPVPSGWESGTEAGEYPHFPPGYGFTDAGGGGFDPTTAGYGRTYVSPTQYQDYMDHPAPGAPFGTQPVTDAERQRTADVPGGDLTTGFGPYQTTDTERKATQAFVNYNMANDDLQQASDSFTAKYGPDQFNQLFPSLHGEADKLGQDMQSYVDYVNAGGYYDEGVWQGLLDTKANLDQRYAAAQQQAAQRYGPDGQPTGQYADDLNALLALDARQNAAGVAVGQAGDQITQAQLATLANNQGYGDAASRTLDDLSRRYRQAQQDEASIAFAQNAWDFRNANDVLSPYQGPRAPDQSVLDAPAPPPAPPGPGGIRGALGHIGGALGHVAGGVVGGLERVAGLNPIVPPTDPRYVGAGMTNDPLGSAISGSSLAMAPFQYPLDVINRSLALGTYGVNRTAQQYGAGEWGNALKSTAMDFLQYPQHIPYVFTGQGWGMAPTDYQQLQFQARHPLDPLLPASWGDLPGTQQGGYNTFALGGLTRAGDFLSALGRGGAPHAPLGAGGGIDLSAWDPRNWHGSSIDARALQNDIQSGVPLEELEKRYRGNIAAQVVWDLANPGNWVGPGELLKPAIQGIHALSYGRLEGPAAEAIGRWTRSAHTAESLWKAGDEPVLTSTLAHITGGRSPEAVGQLLNDQRAGLRLPTGLNDPQTVSAINTLQQGVDRVAAARGIDRDAAVQALFSQGTWDNVLRQWAADSGLQGVDEVEAYVLQHRTDAFDNMLGNIIKNEKRLQFGGQGIQNLAAVQHASEMAIATKERAIRIENAVRESQGLAPRGAITDPERAAIIQRFSERPPALASARDRAAFLGDTALGSARAGWLALSLKYELANYAGNWFNALYEGALTPTADLPFVGKAASEIGRFAPIEYPLNFAQKYGIEPNIGQSLNEAVLNAGRKAETLAKPGELVPPTLDAAVKKNAFQQAGGYFSDTMTQAGARMGRFGQAINVPRALMGSLVKLALPLAENQARFALHHVDFHQELTRRAAEIVANAYDRWGTNPNARQFLDELVAFINDGHVHPDEIGKFIAEAGGFRGVARPFDPIVPESGMARGRPSGGPRGPRDRGPEPPVLTQLDPTKPESTLERFASNMDYFERNAARAGAQGVLESPLAAAATDAAEKLNIDLPPGATNSDLLAALREKLPGRDLNAANIRDTFGGVAPTPGVAVSQTAADLADEMLAEGVTNPATLQHRARQNGMAGGIEISDAEARAAIQQAQARAATPATPVNLGSENAGTNARTGTHAENAPTGAFGDQLKASRAEATERLRQKWTTSGIVAPHADIQDLKDLAVIAAEVLYRGYTNVSEFTDEFRRVLTRDFKVPIPENIDYPQIHALAQKQLDYQLKLTKGQGITGLDSLHELFQQGAHGAGWYDNAVQAIWALFGDDAPLFTAMIAMTSSNAMPYENLLKALKAYRDIKTTGRAFGGTGERIFPDVARSINDILAGTRIGTGEWKTNVFNLNNLGNTERVTVDRWMLRALGFPLDKVQNWSNWLFAEQVYRGIAEKLGVNPRQVQAAIWTAVHPIIGHPLNEYGYGEMLREFARSGALDWMAKVDDPAVRAGYQRAMADAAAHELPPGGGTPWSPLTANEYTGRGSVPGGTLGISPTGERERTIAERLGTDAAWPRPIDVRMYGPNGEPLVYSPGGALEYPLAGAPSGGFNPALGPGSTRTGPPQLPPHIQAMVDERQRTLKSARAYTSSPTERAALRTAGEKMTSPDLTTSQSLQAREAAIRARIAERGPVTPLGVTYRFNADVVAANVRDYAQWGATRIARAAVDFVDWSKEMIGRFTDPGLRTPQQIDHFNANVRPNLQAIYDEASRAVKENDISSRTRPQRLNDAALAPAAQHLQDIVDDPSSYRNVLDTLASRRDTMSNTAFIKELKAYGSATGVHMGSATGELADTFQRFREGLAELRVQVDPSYKSAEAVKARARLAAEASANAPPAYSLTRAGGPQPRQITRPLGNIPADERAARVRDAALERQYRVSEFNRLFAPESGPITDFGAPGTIGEATTGTTREAAATARMYRDPQGMREGPAYRGALPTPGAANDLPWDLKYLGAGPEPPLQLPARTGPAFDPTAASNLPGDLGGTMRPPGPLLGPDYPTYHAGAQIGGPGAPGFTMGQGAMGSPRLGPSADLLTGATSPFVREAWKQTPEWQAMVSEMLSTLPNQWRQAIAHANADAFMNSVRVFNNYGLQLKGVSNLLGGLSPFFQYQIKTPLYWASVAARNPGIVGGIARATDDVRQYNTDSGLRRNSALNKVWLGDKWGVDLRDLIPLTRAYDALFNRSNISDDGAVMRQDPISQGVRNYLESGVSFGMWPWASAALQAAGVTHPPLANMTEPPAINWLGNAAEGVGLPREVGSFIGSVLSPGDSGERAFRAGLEKLAPVAGRLPDNTQAFLHSTFPNGLEENNGLTSYYAGWFLRQMVDQGVTDQESATHAATYKDGPVWQEAVSRVRQWSQDGYNTSMFYPGRVGQLLPGEAEGKKPVYAETNPAPFFYARGAGEGGRDAGIRYPVRGENGEQVIKEGAPQYYAPQPGATANALDILYDRSIPDYADEKQRAARYLRDNNVGVADKEMNGVPSEHATAEAQRHRDNAINYVLEHNAPYTNAYSRRAGEGGTDLGTGEISAAGNYYIQSPDDEMYATAKAQLNPALLTFGSARASDYARDYLKGFGTQDVTNQGQPSEQRTTAANQRFQAQQVESDISTGRYLPPGLRPGLIDYRMAQDAYEGVPMKDPGTGQTVLVKEFLNTAGYYNLLDQAAQQRDQGDTAGLARTQGQLDWITSVPQVRDYLNATKTAAARDQMPLVNLRRDDALMNPDTRAALAPLSRRFEFIGDNGERVLTSGQSFNPRDQGGFGVRRDRILYDQLTDSERSSYQAWNDWKNSPDGQRYDDLQAQQRAAGDFGSPGEKAWFKAHQDEVASATNTRNAAIKAIAAQTGENPVSVANKVGGGLYADFKASTTAPKDLTVYPTGGGSGGSGGYSGGSKSYSSRGPSVTALAIEARKTFFDAFDTLSKNEKAAAYDLKSLDSALAKGSRLSASEWGKALETLQREVPNIRDRQAASDSFYSFYDRLSSSEKSAIRDLMSFDRKSATADDWRRTLQRAQDRLSGGGEYDSNTTRGAVRTTRGGAYSAFYDQRSASSPVALPVDLVERFGWAGAKKVMAQSIKRLPRSA